MVEYIKYIVAFGIAALSIYNKAYRRLYLGVTMPWNCISC